MLTRVTTDRQVSHSSLNQAEADQLALSATDQIVSDLKQEVVNGSTLSTMGTTYTVYVPTGTNIVPVPDGTPSDKSIPNLIKRSQQNDIPGSPAVGSRASAVSSTLASLNGRSVTPARWNKHYFIPRDPALYSGSNANKIGTDPLPSFTPPDWVFVTNNGPAVISAPTTSVIGRYAYAIYDEGGLLDVNVAGYPADTISGGPNGLSPAQIGPKGALAFADLTQVPTTGSGTLPQSQINNIVGWRNTATAQLTTGSFGSYTFTPPTPTNWLNNFVSNNTGGFLGVSTMTVGNPARTDQALLNRQQLLALRSSLGFGQDSLKHIGTFSRELNAPSWGPTQNASGMGGNDGSGVPLPYAYATNRDNLTVANRFFPNVRVSSAKTITSYKSDGQTTFTYTINAGEPLVQRRFLLGRLKWLTRNGALAGTDNAIQACFGLKWDSATFSWKYVGPTGSTLQTTIANLNTVTTASPAREPNFFELLKAGILSGSVGLQPGAAADVYVVDNTYADLDGQVIQIGANIIDQFDADSFPTRIQFGSRKTGAAISPPTTIGATAYYGSENVPMLYRLVYSPYRPRTTQNSVAGDPTSQNNFDAWLEPVLWTPAQGPVTDEPVAVRVRFVRGSGSGIFGRVTDSTGNTIRATTAPPLVGQPTNRSLTLSKGTQASLSGGNQDPRLLRDLTASGMQVQTSTTPPAPQDLYAGDGVTYLGFWLGQQTGVPAGTFTGALTNMTWDPAIQPGHTFVMEANYATSASPNWQEFQRITLKGGTVSPNPNSTSNGNPWATPDVRLYSYTCADPRTGRFGLTLQSPTTYTALNNTTATPPHPFYSTTSFYSLNSPPAEQIQDKYLPTGARFNPQGSSSLQSGFRFYDNTSASASDTSPFYTDPDGVTACRRRALGECQQ